jgi:hypothetical protein
MELSELIRLYTGAWRNLTARSDSKCSTAYGLGTALTLTPLTSVSCPPMASCIASSGSLGRLRQGHRLWRRRWGDKP